LAKITFVDVTLRDGNHTYRHQFTPEIVAATAAALDRAGVDIIEVGHGDGLGGSSLHVGRAAASDEELLRAACRVVKRARIAILLVPGFGLFNDLEMAADAGVKVARVATHCTEADITEQHLRRAKDLGMFTVGYLISAGMASPEQLAEEARKLESYGADYVNLAESQGHLVPTEVAARAFTHTTTWASPSETFLPRWRRVPASSMEASKGLAVALATRRPRWRSLR
jgi:4-hydroxy 2-oxovalerate aldolase